MQANTLKEEEPAEITREKFVGDLKTVVRDAESLMKVASEEVGEKARAARERLGAALEHAKATYHRLEERTVAGAKATDKVIRDHPYQSIGIAFALGLLIGVLINRK